MDVVKALIAKKADVNIQDENGFDALMVAAAGNTFIFIPVVWYIYVCIWNSTSSHKMGMERMR